MKYKHQYGLSLVELLVALAIGAVLIAGAVYVYMQSRESYGVNDSVARLQENARYAFSVLEPDIRMSSYWGLVNDPSMVDGRAKTTEAAAAAATGLAHGCGNNYAVDLYNNLQATDASYTLTCAATGTVQPSADTLTVRRAAGVSTNVSVLPLSGDRIRIWSTRGLGSRLFSDGVVPGALPPEGQVNDLIVNAYYVSQSSDGLPAVPSLRRKSLDAGPAFVDQEVVSGVEDLQVQFGIDPTGVNESVTRYMNPGAALTNAINTDGAQVIAVRVWILVRAERPELGFTNTTRYIYGNRDWTPNDGFRRVLFTRTIQIRNSLG